MLLRPLALGLACAACTAAPPTGQLVADPYEGFNRRMHAVNLGLDSQILRPLAVGYQTVTPTLVQVVFGNVAAHLRLPGIAINQVLQGDGRAAAETLARLVVNTAYGALGLLDPATDLGLARAETDFGMTLATWGVGEGVYFVTPLYGPVTSRDGWARLVDFALHPGSYPTGGALPFAWPLGFQTAQVTDGRARNRAVIDDLLYAPGDSYIALRSAYIQNRRRAVAAGTGSAGAALPDIFAE